MKDSKKTKEKNVAVTNIVLKYLLRKKEVTIIIAKKEREPPKKTSEKKRGKAKKVEMTSAK